MSRNYGYMVYDTLFALDGAIHPHGQYSVGGPNNLTTFRDGLMFHDGAPDLGRCDSVDQRRGGKDSMGRCS